MKNLLPLKSPGDAARRLALPLLLIVCGPLAAAAQADFPDAGAFLKSVLKGEDRLSVEARGDLNGDGLEDWAGVIQRRKPDASQTSQLYVLLRAGRGGYRVAERSKEAPVSGTGCCWVEDLRITRSSIYVQHNAKSGDAMEAVTYQFKLYRGEWRQVGRKIYRTDRASDTATDTDVNLLTGAVIEKRQTGDGRPATRRRRERFPARLLSDFDFFERD
ncbi:MAG TPA: hypothetical protein VN228_01795 [Pyrinomonadaceae bacterium]|nr:hypothetical protein [Pyrinomonadaceae bacterium]